MTVNNTRFESYLETLVWETDLEGEFDLQTLNALEEELQRFYQILEETGIYGQIGDHDDQSISHNFWLTRQGTGVGFWDGDFGEVGDELTRISDTFGRLYPYVGDDGKIYI
jgi:hypothetical protein